MPAVDSSAILAIDYDARAARLGIVFVSKLRYFYSDVPAEVYAGLLAAPSKGEYFNAHVRDHYACARAEGGAGG